METLNTNDSETDTPEERAARHARLKAAGWSVGSAADFLELTPEENAIVEIHVGLIKTLRRFRKQANLTQAQLAEKIESAQPVIARMENGDGKSSIDMFIRAILACGATAQDVAAVFADAAVRAGTPRQAK